MGAGIPQITPEALADQDYAMRAKRQDDLGTARAYFAAHPEELPKTDPTAGMQPPKSPTEAAQQQQQVEGFQGSEVAETTGDKVIDYAAGAPGTLVTSGLKLAGASPEHSELAGNLTNAALMGYGLAKGGVAAYKGIKGMLATGAEEAPSIAESVKGAVTPEKPPVGTILDAQGQPMNASVATGASRPATTQGSINIDEPRPEFVAERLAKAGAGNPGLSIEHPNDMRGQIVYRNPQGEPVASLEFSKIYTDPKTGERFQATTAPEGLQPSELSVDNFAVDKSKGLLSGKAATAVGQKAAEMGINPGDTMSADAANFLTKFANKTQSLAQPGVGPATAANQAAQTLAQKQLDALKTVRVGKTVAEEFGKPEIATQMSNEDTMKAAQDLRMNLESVYNDPIKPPELSAQTAGLAKVFQGESQDLHDTATGLLQRMNAGEDVSKEVGDLSNRFSAFAVQYAKIAGARSEMGRGLQILDPLKPENVRVTETAKLAQQLSEGNNSRDLVEMLARMTPDQLPRTARQMQETVSTGGAIYNAIHEYYIDNLLSDVARTSGRIGLSNSVSSIMQLASRQVASMLPGSPIKAGEPLAQMQGISDGFWHAVDAAMESAKTGERVAMMEDAPEASPLLASPSIAAKPFGLEGTTLGTALDYLGSVLRMPQRGLVAVHQFGWSIAKSMEMHGLAWRQAVDGAQGEGLSGAEGYKRATEIYRGAIKAGFSPEVRAAASNAADVTTFANAIEGKYPQALQTLAHAPGINLVIPFFRVAYNVKKMGLDYTPGVGALTGMATADDSAAKYMVAGKQALASVMAGLVAHEVVKGNLTGDGPPPGAARDALMEQGWRPNSWKVGDRYIKVPEPLAFPLSTVANTVELGKQLDAPTYEQRAAMVVQAMGRAFANDSLVQGIVNLKQLANDAEEQGFGPASEKFAGKTAAGFVPFSGLLGAIHRSQDPYVRNPRTMGEQVKSQLPDLPGGLASQYTAGSVSPRYDIFGKPVVGMPGVPENLLYPVNVTKDKLDPVESMIAAVQPNFAKVPTVISGRKQKLLDDPNNPDIGVPLTPAEQDKWAKTRGEGLYEQFDNLRRSPAFENSSTDMKKTMLEYVGAKYAEIATAKMLTEPGMMARYVARQKARAATLTPHDMSTASTEAPSIEP